MRNPFQGGVVLGFVIPAKISRSNLPRQGERLLDAMPEEVLAAIWEQNDAPLANAVVGAPYAIWALRHALSEGVKRSSRLIAFDLAFGRGDITLFLDYTKTEMPKRLPGVAICDFGHIGDGGYTSMSSPLKMIRVLRTGRSKQHSANGSSRLASRVSRAVSAPSTASAARIRASTTIIRLQKSAGFRQS